MSGFCVFSCVFVANQEQELTGAKSGFQKALLEWFRANRRALPWRTERSLYRTVVSEFMLQQTQVKTMLPFFDAWMKRFPDFATLAAEPESAVLKAWEGLGYYSRARNLHKLAKAVVASGKPPMDVSGWLEMPGVGPYTAAAISSIACDVPAACVDGNIVRVYARLTNTRTVFPDNAAATKHFTPLASALINKRHPGDHNEALMELGATICTKSSPACLLCPVSRFCAGSAAGRHAEFPRIARKAAVKRGVARAWCVERGRLLLHRAGDGGRLAGLHELPELSALGIDSPGEAPLLTRTRSITHHRITESVHEVHLSPSARKKVGADANHVWVPLPAIGTIPLSGPHKRWIAEILALASGSGRGRAGRVAG